MRTTTPTLRRLSRAAVASRPAATERRPIRWVAWWAACLVCGGLVGLLFAVIGALRGGRPSRRRVLLVVTGTALQLVCAGVATVTIAADGAISPATVRLENSAARALRVQDHTPGQLTRTVVNLPVSGAALLYAAAKGGRPYRGAANGTVVVSLQDGVARGGTMYGTVLLTNRQATTSAAIRGPGFFEHEVRHSNQWAVSTLLAGPAAFPALYAADESLFPGAHNHFERQAGLSDGGYHPPHDSPPAGGRLAFLLVGLVAGYRLAAHRFPRLTAAPDAPRAHRGPRAGPSLEQPQPTTT
jgi:hypothetical protein